MLKIILPIIIPIYIFAYEFKLNQYDISYIKNSNSKNLIINRINNYQKLKEKIKNYSIYKKLHYVNSHINRIQHKNDHKTLGKADYWATPKEFLINGFGDCEDFAIAKYFTLVELGIKKENLYLAVVKAKPFKHSHMVLLYKQEQNSSPLVLDSLSFKIKALNKRSDLIAKLAFNEFEVVKLKKEGLTNKVITSWQKQDKWNKLLKKAYSTIQ